jgi:hypothetical protein
MESDDLLRSRNARSRKTLASALSAFERHRSSAGGSSLKDDLSRPHRMFKKAVSRPQRVKARGVPLWYVEGLNDARTPLAGFFGILLTVFGEADKIQMVIVVGKNRFRLVPKAHEKVNVSGGVQHRAGIKLVALGRNLFDFMNQRFCYPLVLMGRAHG